LRGPETLLGIDVRLSFIGVISGVFRGSEEEVGQRRWLRDIPVSVKIHGQCTLDVTLDARNVDGGGATRGRGT